MHSKYAFAPELVRKSFDAAVNGRFCRISSSCK